MNGTTTTRRRTETGRQENLMMTHCVSLTRQTDSRTPAAGYRSTTLARNPRVTFIITGIITFYRASYMLSGYMPWPCVCVCLFATSWRCTKMAKHKNTQTTPHDSPGLYFSDAKNLFEIWMGSPPTGAPNAGGVGRSWRISTNNSPYLENATRYRRIVSIKDE